MWKKSEGTRHSSTCKMVFGRKDPSCPRCQELLAGAKARSWGHTCYRCGKTYVGHYCDPCRAKDIKAHNCVESKCGPVCTAFDW